MKPLFARVLLERKVRSKVGSIIIPEDRQQALAYTRCKVLDVGPNCDPSVQGLIGKHVLIGKYAGDWINANGEPGTPSDVELYYICQDEDLLAVLE